MPNQRQSGRRIVHQATAEERTRHAEIRRQIEQELPELSAWARQVAASESGQTAVGAVFTAEERPVIDAIDAYASGHSLPGRAAVVREALGRLLGLSISPEPPSQ
jgi:hypothetical protein